MAIPLITVIGSLNKDLVTRTPRMPKAGETLTASSFSTGSGGKGANQAVACARLSRFKDRNIAPHANVRMIGAVGDDQYGRELTSSLANVDIDVTGIQVRQREQTGIAVIIVEEKSGENRILVSPNANSTLRRDDFPALPMPLPALIVLQLEIPTDAVVRVIELAKEARVEVLLNPAPATELPLEVYRGLSHLILNQSEAKELSRTTGDLVVQDAGRKFLDMGVKNVVITLGAEGAFYCSIASERSGVRPVVEEVHVVDTTAAGDTFVGAYAARIARHKKTGTSFDLEEAVDWANSAAIRAVEKAGAQDAIPWLDDMSSH